MSFQATVVLTAFYIVAAAFANRFVALLLNERFPKDGVQIETLSRTRLVWMLSTIRLLFWPQWSNWFGGAFTEWLTCFLPSRRPDVSITSCFSSASVPHRAYPLSCCLLE